MTKPSALPSLVQLDEPDGEVTVSRKLVVPREAVRPVLVRSGPPAYPTRRLQRVDPSLLALSRRDTPSPFAAIVQEKEEFDIDSFFEDEPEVDTVVVDVEALPKTGTSR